MATCAAIVNTELKDQEAEDSYNLLPTLIGTADSEPIREATVHHSVDGKFAIRKGPWKLIFAPGSGGWSFPTAKQAKELDIPPIQLYNLEDDIGEQNNLQEQHPEIVKELTDLLQSYIDKGRSTPGKPQQNTGETPFM